MTKKKPERKRARVHAKISGVSKTDKSMAKATDINTIVKTYQKTGVLPQGRRGYYADISNIPLSLNEAFSIVEDACDAYNELPAQIRKQMGNDPSKLEEFVNDENNYDILVEHGIINKKKEIIKDADNINKDSSKDNSSQDKQGDISQNSNQAASE